MSCTLHYLQRKVIIGFINGTNKRCWMCTLIKNTEGNNLIGFICTLIPPEILMECGNGKRCVGKTSPLPVCSLLSCALYPSSLFFDTCTVLINTCTKTMCACRPFFLSYILKVKRNDIQMTTHMHSVYTEV